MAQYTGEVEWSNDTKERGSLVGQNGPDVFCHFSSMHGDGRQPLVSSSTDVSAASDSVSHVDSDDRQTANSKGNRNYKLKVIVADDEQIIADTLTLILNRSGFEARAVYSGEAALEVLDCFEPDVLISDVVMAGMTGVEAAMAVQVLQPNCKVLLFSGQAATADLLHDARTQGHDFEIIAKPIHPSQLLARLRTGAINWSSPSSQRTSARIEERPVQRS
jgi:CheY-like chemotaxis protein